MSDLLMLIIKMGELQIMLNEDKKLDWFPRKVDVIVLPQWTTG